MGNSRGKKRIDIMRKRQRERARARVCVCVRACGYVSMSECVC